MTFEAYDTGASFRDCSGKRSLDDVVKWIESVKIVEPPYNRIGGQCEATGPTAKLTAGAPSTEAPPAPAALFFNGATR